MSTVEYGSKIINYQIHKADRKNLYINVQDGNVLVKSPIHISDEEIHKLVEKKKKWIYEKLEISKKSNLKPKEYISGECFKILGRNCTLKIIYDDIKTSRIERNGYKLFVFLPISFKILEYKYKEQKEVEKLIENFYIELAKKEVKELSDEISKRIELYPNNIKIRKLICSWGNCSSKKNVTINYKVVMYSRKTIEYVILHEFCHIKYMNHSKKFWNMISLYMNDYYKAVKELER
jgi:predicted metal-dependent hydrolase